MIAPDIVAMNVFVRLNASHHVSERCQSRLDCTVWMTCSRSAAGSGPAGRVRSPEPATRLAGCSSE